MWGYHAGRGKNDLLYNLFFVNIHFDMHINAQYFIFITYCLFNLLNLLQDKAVKSIEQFRPKFNNVKEIIYTEGCLKKFYQFVETNMWTMVYIGGGILVFELMIMYLVKKLETQILMQKHS